MNPAQIYQTLLAAGWGPQQAVVMTAIALAESSGNPSSVSKPNKNGTVDRGLFQINSVHGYDPNRLLDPAFNAKAAYDVAGGKDFTRWSTYNSGAYQKFMGEASAAAAGGGGSVTAPSSSPAAPPKPPDLGVQLKQASDAASGDQPVQATVGEPLSAPGVNPAPAPPPAQPTSAPAAQPAQASGPAAVAIQTALAAQQNKTPYVWGGNSLQGGVDCSGLIQQAYKAAGINLPRVSNQQIDAGQHIDPSQMAPGDLLGWAYNNSLGGGATHIAMYIGGGMMVEALHKGEPVHVVPVRTPQFVTRVTGGVQAQPANQSAAPQQQPQNNPNDSLEARLAAIANAVGGALSSGIQLPGASK